MLTDAEMRAIARYQAHKAFQKDFTNLFTFDELEAAALVGAWKAHTAHNVQQASLQTYASTCAHYEVLTWIRDRHPYGKKGRHAFRPMGSGASEDEEIPGPLATAVGHEPDVRSDTVIRETLEAIRKYAGPKEAHIVEQYFNGSTYAQIARDLGRSTANISKRMQNLRRSDFGQQLLGNLQAP